MVQIDLYLWIPFSVFVIIYICYYASKCGRPCIYAKKNSMLVKRLSKECPAFKSYFLPSFFFTLPNLQSYTTELDDSLSYKDFDFKTRTITLPDNGEVFYTEPEATSYPRLSRKLVAVIVPGYTGDHYTTYVLKLARILLEQDVWPVIFTDRGKGGVPMRSQKFFSAGYNDGLAKVLDTIMDTNVNSKFAVIGISFGGMVAANTILHHPRRKALLAQVLISTPLSSLQTIKRLNSFSAARLLYNIPFGHRIKALLLQSEDIYKSSLCGSTLLRNLKACKSMTDIDEKFIAPMFGYSSVDAYYRDICLSKTLQHIHVPTVCINADDDPCFTKEMYPIRAIKSNPNVCLVGTKAGGHYGFAGMTWPYSLHTFSDQILQEMFSMLRKDLRLDLNSFTND